MDGSSKLSTALCESLPGVAAPKPMPRAAKTCQIVS
jgi:hypothetical protein